MEESGYLPESNSVVFGWFEWEEGEEPIARIEEESVVGMGLVGRREGEKKRLEWRFWVSLLGGICSVDRLKVGDAILQMFTYLILKSIT